MLIITQQLFSNSNTDNIISDEIKGSLESIDAFISYRRVGGSQLARFAFNCALTLMSKFNNDFH